MHEERDPAHPPHRPAVSGATSTDDAAYPATAEALMRSRFAAFRDANVEWLLQTWHPSTRPDSLDLSDNPRWRGLQIVDTVDGGENNDTGVVEFRATYVAEVGGIAVLHERSRFVREGGRWLYVDGDMLEG